MAHTGKAHDIKVAAAKPYFFRTRPGTPVVAGAVFMYNSERAYPGTGWWMESLNSYAIVAYVGGRIARFVDRLRGELSPGCPHHAHITVLPPRPLESPASEAAEFARPLVAQFEPFEVRLGDVMEFRNTQVIYISLTSGVVELSAMHDVLNTGVLEQAEAYNYIPHITLGCELPPGSFDPSLRASRDRWHEFGAPPPVRIETLTLVQQRADRTWINLAEFGLGRVPAVG